MIKSHQGIDVFGLQEVCYNAFRRVCDDTQAAHLNIFKELAALLPGPAASFRPVVGKGYGLAVFVKKNIEVVGEGALKIYDNPKSTGWGPSHSRKLQWVACRQNNQLFHTINVQGLWKAKEKKIAFQD